VCVCARAREGTRGQSPKAITFQNTYMVISLDQGDGCSKEDCVRQGQKPKLWLRSLWTFFTKKNPETDKILAVRLEGLCLSRNEMGCSRQTVCVLTLGLAFAGQVERLWDVMALDLAFGGITLCPTKGSNSHILLATFNPFLWALYKVQPFNPTAS
jgi:hypothetical protein